MNDVSKDELDQLALEILDGDPADDPISRSAQDYFLGGKITEAQFLEDLLRVHYLVGVVGVKMETFLPRQWSFVGEPELQKGHLKSDSLILVHQTFWAAFGIVLAKGQYAEAND